MYKIEFEHGTTTGKRIVRVNGREVVRHDWMFKLVGREAFEINGVKCVISVEAVGIFAYEYSLTVNGKAFQKFREQQKKALNPDLSPHLHTAECNFLVQLLYKCQAENTFGKYVGACNYWDEAVWQCTKKERIWRRAHNPRYKKRLAELKHLPEEYYTPALWKLREEGSLPDFQNPSGCKI
ncbi:COX assembly mitochondrial protein [Aphelenchoides fujianensis]|nr:COX assembly mitochondrial protein [Aphelenchoides fujianensis]